MRQSLRVVLVLACAHLLGGCSYNYDKLGGFRDGGLIFDSKDGGSGGAAGGAGAGSGGGFITGVAGAGGGPSGVAGAGGTVTGVAGSGGGPSGVAGSGGGPSSSGVAGSGGGPSSSGVAGSGGGPSGVAGAGGHASGGSTGAGGTASPNDPDLVLWYKFDETSGQTAADSSGYTGGPHNATLATGGTGGSCGFSTAVHKVGTGAVSLTANGVTGGGYVAVPSLYDLVPDAVTIASWVYTTSSSQYQRLFDFGNDTTTFMFLALADSTTFVRFTITNTGTATEQRIQTSTTLTLNAWHHVALVLAGGNPHVGYIYVDGVLANAGASPALTLGVHDLGATTANYLGKSQFTADSYLTGEIDDFRVYKRALTLAEITTIYGLR